MNTLNGVRCLVLASCVAASSAIHVLGVERRGAEAQVNALVRQLGDESHKEREVAENALAEYDRSILPILTKLKRSKDPEVRLRASRIIAKLLADPAKAPYSSARCHAGNCYKWTDGDLRSSWTNAAPFSR